MAVRVDHFGQRLWQTHSVPQSRFAPGSPAINEQLARLLASRHFDASSRGRGLLRFLVGETLANRQEGLSLAAIAQKVFGRGADFDSSLDPAVRIEVARLGRALDRYYRLAGAEDPVTIGLPRGETVPVVRWAAGDRGRRKISETASRPAALAHHRSARHH